MADAQLFKDRFNISVYTGTEVISIDAPKQTITVRELASGQVRTEAYDALVLSPGSSPIRPPLPGIDLAGIFTLRSIPDSKAIKAWTASRQVQKAVVVGGGFIGLEMAENLTHLGLKVTIVEMLDQVMPPLDKEMAALVAAHLRDKGVKLALGDGVAGFENPVGGLVVRTKNGAFHEADVVIFAVGVCPETGLATSAGLKLGVRGGNSQSNSPTRR